ncbi:MAG: L,D-transpeptidase family protein [Rhodospirillaceae bacterium]|nr:L,D-transpeptidase family protein [Rhodospirillales bacterium]
MNAPKASIIAACASSLLLALAGPARAEDGAVLMAEMHRVQAGENLLDLARSSDLGYVELMAANPGADPWLPRAGGEILLPTSHLPPSGFERAPLVANLGDMRLYWRGPDGTMDSFPMGIGQDGWGLQPTLTRVVGKRHNPVWVPPPSIRAEKPYLPERIPPGPDNPLGEYSLDLALGLVRIHGTNLPDGVGRRVSHGCLRLYPEDIAKLFPQVAMGTPVMIVDEPIKLAWLDGELWLEIHPTPAMADAIESRRPAEAPPVPDLEARVTALAGEHGPRLDWKVVGWAETHRLGVPVRITRPTAGEPLALRPQ